MLHAQWLDALKIAIIENHHDSIIALTEQIPPLTQEEALQANDMIKETIILFQKEKIACQRTMEKIKKNAAFLAQAEKKPRLSTLS